MAKRVVSPHSTGNCTQSLPLEHSTAGLDVGAHCICARVGTCDFHCRGRPIAALTMRWRFVGVDLLIDPSAQRPGRGGGMRACRPTVRCTQKTDLLLQVGFLCWRYLSSCVGKVLSRPRRDQMFFRSYAKNQLAGGKLIFCVGVTYLPVQSPAKYCRRR